MRGDDDDEEEGKDEKEEGDRGKRRRKEICVQAFQFQLRASWSLTHSYPRDRKMRLAGREGDHSTAWRCRFGAQARGRVVLEDRGGRGRRPIVGRNNVAGLEQESRCYHALVVMFRSSTLD